MAKRLELVHNGVLDSWPLLELLKGSHAGLEMERLLNRAKRGEIRLLISRINYGEVLYVARKELRLDPGQMNSARQLFPESAIEILSVTDARVDQAVGFKSRYNISFADGFAAGLAAELQAPLVTGDKEFRPLASDGLISLYWVER